MKEHLTVDSVMTADGEVVLLGPVDKDGHRVPLDTTDLYGPRGEHYKVKSFVHFPLMDGWFMECAFTHDLIDVSSLRLKAPDSWEKLLEDLGGVLQQGGRSGHKACPRCGVEPKMEDVRERSLTKPNVMSVKCPACGMSNSIAWGSMDLPPFRQAVAMLADSWNSR